MYNAGMEYAIDIPQDQLADVCQRYDIHRVLLFGSVLRPDFGPESDIDLLVEFMPGVAITLRDLDEVEAAFSAILGRPVDLGEYASVIEDPNYLRRRGILESAAVIYES
jgi:hypothetical protein